MESLLSITIFFNVTTRERQLTEGDIFYSKSSSINTASEAHWK